jgi:hypothetical protein
VRVGEVAILTGVEVQRPVGAFYGEYGNDAISFVEGAELLGPADLGGIGARTQQGKRDLACIYFVFDLPAPNHGPVKPLLVEPGVEAFLREGGL